MADQDQVRTLMQAPFLRLLGVEVDSIEPGRVVSVSYTHLTLPTILRV